MSVSPRKKVAEAKEPSEPKPMEAPKTVNLKEQLRVLVNSAPSWNPNATAKFCGEFGDAYYTFISQLKALAS